MAPRAYPVFIAIVFHDKRPKPLAVGRARLPPNRRRLEGEAPAEPTPSGWEGEAPAESVWVANCSFAGNLSQRGSSASTPRDSIVPDHGFDSGHKQVNR